MSYQIILNIAEDSEIGRLIESVATREQLSREEAALRLLEEKRGPTGASVEARKIIGAFKEDAALMDETLELIMEERVRRNSALPHD